MKRVLVFLFVLTAFSFPSMAHTYRSIDFEWMAGTDPCHIAIDLSCEPGEIGANGNAYEYHVMISGIVITPATAAASLVLNAAFWEKILTSKAADALGCISQVPPCEPVHPGDSKGMTIVMTYGQCVHYSYTPLLDTITQEVITYYLSTFHDSHICDQDTYCQHSFFTCVETDDNGEPKKDKDGNILYHTNYIGSFTSGGGTCLTADLPPMEDKAWTTDCMTAPCDKFIP